MESRSDLEAVEEPKPNEKKKKKKKKGFSEAVEAADEPKASSESRGATDTGDLKEAVKELQSSSNGEKRRARQKPLNLPANQKARLGTPS